MTSISWIDRAPELAQMRIAGAPHAIGLWRAESFFARLRGLLGRGCLPPGNALLLAPCRAIHTCFMRFAIDAVFVAREGEVLAVRERLRPFRSAGHPRAAYCLEFAAGEAARLGIREGLILEWSP